MATPSKLKRIVDLFAGAPNDVKLEALLEYSRKLPPLPDRFGRDPGLMEAVPECQTPFFLATEVAQDGTVAVWFDCPPEAPTTRGFAGILAEGLNGARVEDVLALPDAFYTEMGLEGAISSLRLRGMSAILARLKRQVGEAAPAPA
ncbi:MAG: SufE family protein [Acidimicrobiales bacterium]